MVSNKAEGSNHEYEEVGQKLVFIKLHEIN